MNKIIRKGVFETNSSSTHSIAVNSDTFIKDTSLENHIYDGRLTLGIEDYEWDWFKFNDAYHKADYLALQYGGVENLLKEVLLENVEGLREVVYSAVGHIDHQSVGISISHNKEEIENFIFNRNSWLFGGNDNHIQHPNFKDVAISNLKYIGKLIIDEIDQEQEVLIKEGFSEKELNDAIEFLLDGYYYYENGPFLSRHSFLEAFNHNYFYFAHPVMLNFNRNSFKGKILLEPTDINKIAQEQFAKEIGVSFNEYGKSDKYQKFHQIREKLLEQDKYCLLLNFRIEKE